MAQKEAEHAEVLAQIMTVAQADTDRNAALARKKEEFQEKLHVALNRETGQEVARQKHELAVSNNLDDLNVRAL